MKFCPEKANASLREQTWKSNLFFPPFVLKSLWSPPRAPRRAPASALLCPVDPCQTFSDHRSSHPTRSWYDPKPACLLGSSKLLVQPKAFDLASLYPARALLCRPAEPGSPPNPGESSPGTPTAERCHQPPALLRDSSRAVQTVYLYPTRTSHLSIVTPTSTYI